MAASIIKQMFNYADKLVQNSDPCYVLNDPSLSKIGEKTLKNATSFLKFKPNPNKLKTKKKK